METKLKQLKDRLAAGDAAGALRIAAGFGRLGEHRERITRAWVALTNPRFYRDELGMDPAALVADGVAALRERYGVPATVPDPADGPPTQPQDRH
jgi:hypothetical protein